MLRHKEILTKSFSRKEEKFIAVLEAEVAQLKKPKGQLKEPKGRCLRA